MNILMTPLDETEVLNKLYISCRTCYNPGTPEEIFSSIDQIDKEAKIKLITQVTQSGHLSVLEHQNLTFLVSGVSRALTHQLVRHRIASYSQQSQRYCEFKNGIFDYIIPDKIKQNKDALNIFEELMKRDSETYNTLIKLGIPAEDARSVLPNACSSNIVVTMNLRSFIHFCNERLCTCAQLEIRKMATEMAKQASKSIPFLSKFFSPKCIMLGYCNESEKRSCGRKKLFKDLISE